MDVTIVGNFDVYGGTINPSFQQTGKWYDYFSGDSLQVTKTDTLLTLLPGEYHLYTSVKLQKPLFTGLDEKMKTIDPISVVYPNPSSQGFNIRFSISYTMNVGLTIYDMFGKPVRSFSKKEYGPGTYVILWDRMDESGKQVNPGIYFYRIDYGFKSEMNKMIVQ
jgi:hypothetical protein